MITALDRLSTVWATIKARYERWEQRQVTAKLARWPTRRRLAVFVWLPIGLLLCCGGPVSVPIVWALRETAKAGGGAASPDAAASDYLMSLGYNNEEGLLPILDDEHQDELLAGWRAYRRAMDSTTARPSRLDYGTLSVGPITDGQAQVTVDVAATWWGTEGRAEGYSSDEHTWRFLTREDNGWHVVEVDAPTWCGGYVRVDACE